MASFPYSIIRNLDVYLPFLAKIYNVTYGTIIKFR